MKMSITIIILILFSANLYSQSTRSFIRKGNKEFKEKNYNEAEINYRKSLEIEPNSDIGLYNLGSSLYKQENYQDATYYYGSLANKELDSETKAKIYHNLGNTLFQQQKYAESIESYKNALRNNPNDLDTKYNLEYARRMLIQQEQQQQQNQNQQQNQQNQNQEKQQEQQDQQQENQQQQQRQEQRKDQISKEDAERMLQALDRKEKDLQKEKIKRNAEKNKYQKNW